MRKSLSTIEYDRNARINSSFTRKIQQLNLDPVRYYEGRPIDVDKMPSIKGARLG